MDISLWCQQCGLWRGPCPSSVRDGASLGNLPRYLLPRGVRWQELLGNIKHFTSENAHLSLPKLSSMNLYPEFSHLKLQLQHQKRTVFFKFEMTLVH